MWQYLFYLFFVTWQLLYLNFSIWLLINCCILISDEFVLTNFCIIRSLRGYLSAAEANIIIDDLFNLNARFVISTFSWASAFVRTIANNHLIFFIFFAEANLVRDFSLSPCLGTHFVSLDEKRFNSCLLNELSFINERVYNFLSDLILQLMIALSNCSHYFYCFIWLRSIVWHLIALACCLCYLRL